MEVRLNDKPAPFKMLIHSKSRTLNRIARTREARGKRLAKQAEDGLLFSPLTAAVNDRYVQSCRRGTVPQSLLCGLQAVTTGGGMCVWATSIATDVGTVLDRRCSC